MTPRVLHIDTERGWRGGERQALWLARELARSGASSIVAARGGEPLALRAAEAGLPVVHCNPSSELDVRAALALRRVLLDRRVALVHAHTAHAVAIAALAVLGTSVRMVASRRVDFPLRRNVGTRWKYGRASAIIAVSEAVARVLRASGVADERIAVVPDGVDLGRTVVPARRETLAELGVAAERPLVVQVAQLVGHKDPVNFVRAMARVRDRVPHVQALLVGDGSHRHEVEREIGDLDLADTLHLTGYRTDADALLAAADVVALSSREEGMGSVLLDALALNKPVAATRAGGIPEVIIDGQSGVLVPVRNPHALGDAIARLLTDSSLRERVSTAARDRAKEFSVERMASRTLEVYARVLDGDTRRSRTSATKSSSSVSVTGAP